MKSLIFFVAGLLIAASAGMSQDTMYVHLHTGITAIKIADIDSILFRYSPLPTVTDASGNVYSVVTIGTQKWLQQNLRTTKFNDGSPIPHVSDSISWLNLTGPGYCWYDNDSASYADPYGVLYNFYVIDSTVNGNKNPCPVGFHMPSQSEWLTLINYAGGSTTCGVKLMEAGTAHWTPPNSMPTNELMFTALPGGFRDWQSKFDLISSKGYHWTASEVNTTAAWKYHFDSNDAVIFKSGIDKNSGTSIRCIKD